MKLNSALKVALVFSIAATLSADAQLPTPVLSYDFEGASGTSVPNGGSLGSTYDGTSGSDVSFVAAPTGTGINLGSTVANYASGGVASDANATISINNTAGQTVPFAGDPGLTFAAWINPNAITDYTMELFHVTRAATSVRFAAMINPVTGGSSADGNYYGMQYRAGTTLDGTPNPGVGAAQVTAGAWTFVAYTLGFDGVNATMNIYSGNAGSAPTLIDTATFADTETGYPNETLGLTVALGNHSNGGNAFDGLMDGVNVYGTALSGSQVSDLYNSYVVPEPSSFAMMALGFVGLLIRIRRRRC